MTTESYGTSGGILITDEVINRLVSQAEDGYDLNQLHIRGQIRPLPKKLGHWEKQKVQRVIGPLVIETYVVNHCCVVHRKPSCYLTEKLKQYPVSRNQCMVYKLPACNLCWSNLREYEMYVYGNAR